MGFNLSIRSCHRIAGLLLKGMYEVWGEGCSNEELKEAVNRYPEEHKAPYLAENTTFKIVVDCFGRVLTFNEQAARIESVNYVPFKVQKSQLDCLQKRCRTLTNSYRDSCLN